MCLCWPLGMALDNDSPEYIQYVDRQNLVHVDYLGNDVRNNGICLTLLNMLCIISICHDYICSYMNTMLLCLIISISLFRLYNI